MRPCTTSQAQLLQMLDSAGSSNGQPSLTTSLVRSWVGKGASLEMSGRWEGGLEARQMAMLAVYQERIYNESALLKAAFDLVDSRRPGLFSKDLAAKVLVCPFLCVCVCVCVCV
jgi:hypothetical protein